MRPQFHLLPGLLLAACALTACDRAARAPAKSLATGAPAAPPAPTSSVAAAAPLTTTASPMPVPTPASTALALARDKTAATATAAGGSSAGRSGLCAGRRGADLDACIDALARAPATPVAVDTDASREFRDAQARRDRELMDRDEEEARQATEQADFRNNGDDQPSLDTRDDPQYEDPRYDPPPPADEGDVIYDDPPPDDGPYPRR